MADTKFIRTPSGAGNKKKYTFSIWFKRGVVGAAQRFVTQGDASGDPADWIEINGSDLLDYAVLSSSYRVRLKPAMKFVDTNAWYHVVVKSDSEQASSSDREKIYINGNEITVWDTETYGASDQEGEFCSTSPLWIGADNYSGGTNYAQQYLAQVVLVDGQALDATSFGEFDSDSPNIWKPIDVSGLTFGTNGFYLQYKQSGTSQNSSGLGADTSGNDNHFAVNNLTAVSQSTDTCTNNFCVMNHLDNYFAGSTFSNGNLQVNTANSPYTYNTGTMGMTKGKWYFEGKWISAGSGNSAVGIISTVSTGTSDEAPNKTDSAMYKDDGVVRRNNGNGTSIAEVSNNNLIMVAYDADNNFVYFGYNGTWGNSGDPTSGSSGTGGYDPGNVPASTTTGAYFPMFSDHNSGQGFSMSFNFGSPDYSISSGNSDANNHGNFEYAVPSGYFALCTKKLAEHG